MAERPENSSRYNLVGEGLNPADTMPEVPHAGAVSQSAMSGNSGMSQGQEIPMASGGMEQGSVEGSVGMMDAGQPDMMSEWESLPSYADGSSPGSPLNISPLGLADRFKLSVGNKAGAFNYLKKRFDDVKVDRHGNFVVQKEGVWHRVDPDGYGDGDAWTRTKEIVKDMADLSDIGLLVGGQVAGTAIGSSLGGAAGGVAGGGAAGPVGAVAGMAAGSVPGAIIGAGVGAGAAEGLKTSLGRLVGTYEATPEEQLKDIGTEMLLGLGGETVALGVKPALSAVKRAASTIATKATNNTKEISSAFLAELLGQPRWSIRRAMDAPSEVIGHAEQALKEIGPRASPSEALDVIQGKQGDLVQRIAVSADQGLKEKYRRGLYKMQAAIPESFAAEGKPVVEEAFKALESAGLGKMQTSQRGISKFEMFSEKDLAEAMAVTEDQLPRILGTKTREGVGELVRQLNTYSNLGTFKGKQGAAKLVELRQAMDETFRDLMESDVPSAVHREAERVRQAVNKRIGQTFADASEEAGKAFVEMNKDYSSKVDAVRLLKKAVESKNPNSIDEMVKKLTSKSGAFKQLKDEARSLNELAGGDLVHQLMDMEASKAFVDVVPKTLGAGSLTTAARSGMALTGLGGNPQFYGKAIKALPYASSTLDFIKRLPPEQATHLLQNDKLMAQFLAAPIRAMSSEDEAIQQLLQENGVL